MFSAIREEVKLVGGMMKLSIGLSTPFKEQGVKRGLNLGKISGKIAEELIFSQSSALKATTLMSA